MQGWKFIRDQIVNALKQVLLYLYTDFELRINSG